MPQRLHRLPAQIFAVQRRPLLEFTAAGQGKAIEKRAVVQRHSLGQCRATVITERRRLVAVPTTGFQRRLERDHIDVQSEIGIELQRVAVAEQQRRIGRRFQRMSQAVGRLTQIRPRPVFWPIWPEQPDQLLSPVRPVALHGQIGQQRPRLIRFEGVDIFSISPGGHPAQQFDDQGRHGRPFALVDERLFVLRAIVTEVGETAIVPNQ